MHRTTLFALLLLAFPATAQTLTITGGKVDQANVVINAPFPPESAGARAYAVELPDGSKISAQATFPSIADEGTGARIVFVLPKLSAGKPMAVKLVKVEDLKPRPTFFNTEKGGEYLDVLYDGKPVLRYVNAAHNKEKHYLTFKPFHHLYDPATGKTLLTNGAVASEKEGMFPHHRGLFFGFNRISYGDKQTADIWHGTKGVFSSHEKFTAIDAAELLSRHRSKISWHGEDDKAFASEEREVTVYHVPGSTLIDWASVVRTELPKVRLDGDPQHAGFHFRAAQEVATNGKANTYYLRPDGKDKPGATRNWDPKMKDPKTINLPWDACSFVIEGKRYTVLRVSHPDNPKEARGSEREYGRFGDYFEYDLTPEKPLKVKYRVWLQEGEMTVEQCSALAESFVIPPKVATGK